MAAILKNELRNQIDGQNEEYKEVIIQNETRKFVEIFDRVFSEVEPDKSEDAIDGIVEDILNAIISRVKAIIKQKFVQEIILKEEEDENEAGKNETSSETEA